MEHRVNSLETDLAILKRDMTSCQQSLHKDMEFLKETKSDLPTWIKNSAAGIIFAIFAQTVSTVWWASELSAKQNNMRAQVEKNTAFIDAWPSMHNEVMVGLTEIKSESRHMKEMLQNLQKENAAIKAKQYGHFKDINNTFNDN
jgi:D-mannonate dehydratase